jgi:GNAT superfamily N-acetyltransferase
MGNIGLNCKMGESRVTVTLRQCAGSEDFAAISDFLFGLYQPNNRDGNWFQPIWEYAYTHPAFDDESVQRIGIWEDAGAIVAVATYELRLGEAFFQVHPAYGHLKPAMLDHAEAHLRGIEPDGTLYLQAYVPDFDKPFERVVAARGYELDPECHRPMAQFEIPHPFPAIDVPAGFRLQSLADDNDLVKLDRALWRGFNHAGEPPADGLEDRKKMQSGPHFRKDLSITVVAPDGAFVAFAGLWLDPVNRFGYVEPVATDPDYRRMGLGRAAVLEGIRRCGEEGAQVAYVGSVQPFYLSMGFKVVYTSNCWIKRFST